MAHTTVRPGAGGEVIAMAQVKLVGKVVGVMLMLAVLCPVVAYADDWEPNGAIQCTGITAPTSGKIVGAQSEVICTVATATDLDKRWWPPPSQWLPDTFNNEDAYTWSAGGVGTFKNGDNTGQTVTWVAPDAGVNVTLTVTINDDAELPEGDGGSRDDDPISRDVSIKVVRANLVIANVDEEHEVTEGGFVPLNNDTDDPEDDRVSLGVALAPTLTSGELKLDATAGGDKIKVWTSATEGTEVSLPKTWDMGEEPPPTEFLYVEGLTGSALRGVELTLSYTLDEEMLSDDKVKITVWDFEIEACPEEWVPTYDSTVDIAATLTPSGVSGTITFYLLSSHEDGYCMNATTEGTDDDDRDLQFLAGENSAFNVSEVPPIPYRYYAETKTEVNSATVTVHCYDYGAYTTIMNADTTIGGKTKRAHVVDGTEPGTRIPRDDNDNYIADCWTEFGAETGNASDDNETSPTGDGTAGDGFTRYEEYRGFVVNDTWVRTDPITTKDVFLCDEDGLGNEDFDQTGLTIHMLASDGSEYSGGRVVNFNGSGGSPGGHTDQKGIRMYDGGYLFGVAGEVEEVGTPNQCDWVRIYTESIREACGADSSRTTWEPIDIEVKERTIGHECGHSVNISHHWGGTATCVMHEPCPTGAPVPHVYCTQAPEDCLHAWKLH